MGDNGLTGSGTDLVGDAEFPEPGGLGYVTEFIVRDRPSINGTRTLTYDPLVDRVEPEDGTTTLGGPANNTLYNPVSDPGRAIGFLPAFGDGSDGTLSADGSGTTTVDTGDTPNAGVGNPFQVFDLNPNDVLDGSPVTGGNITYDSVEPFILQLETLIVTSSATLRITGVNPILFRVRGVVQINGTLDVSGTDGLNGGAGLAFGGTGGPGGFDGGESRRAAGFNCSFGPTTPTDFSVYLNACQNVRNQFPFTLSGDGPGRGHPGGDTMIRPSQSSTDGSNSGTGGGGGSHATRGTAGEDRLNADEEQGSTGTAGGFVQIRNSGIIGVRGQPGELYGDEEINDVTMGGSGGGAGGSIHEFGTFGNAVTGGGGGGGGGTISIIAAGSISVPGGVIDASGGDGGNGGFTNWNNSANNRAVSGGGGGGSGGSIVLISGDNLVLAGATLDARGGSGGARAFVGAGVACANCNAGGNGGKGFLFLMDSDGTVDGVQGGDPGTIETAFGVQTVSGFELGRFDAILAVTRLYNVLAANPDYLDIAPGDILANVNPGQRIRIRASSAKGDLDNPLAANLGTETGSFEIALVRSEAGATVVDITGDADDLNPAAQTPARDAFVRITAEFEYDNGPESALGPFASIDELVLSFTFN